MEDPRGDTLKRGTTVTLVLKEEAYDYLEQDTVKDLIKKYSQFINFNIFMWTSKTETVEEPDEDEDEVAEKTEEDKPEDEPTKVSTNPSKKKKLVKSNKSKNFLREIEFLSVLNFFPDPKLIFGHF